MTDILSFPGLGLEITLNRVAFTIAGIDVYWYALLIATGYALAMFFMFKTYKEFGLDADRVIDVILVTTFAGIIGARAYYVALEWDRYKNDLSQILNFRNGGLAIYGALIFGLIAAFFVARWRKVKFLPLIDMLFGGVFIGQALGRWGNFVNMEAFGTNTTLPWGMTSETIKSYIASHSITQMGSVMDPALPVHPTFLYESLWCAVGFFVYLYLLKKRRFDGEMFLFYTAWYGFGRMLIEGMRTDSLWLGPVRASQVLAGLLFVGATVAWFLIKKKIREKDDPEYLKLYKYSEESQLIVAGEYDYNREMSHAEAAAIDAALDGDDYTELEDAEDELNIEKKAAILEKEEEEREAKNTEEAPITDDDDGKDEQEQEIKENLERIADMLEDEFLGDEEN